MHLASHKWISHSLVRPAGDPEPHSWLGEHLVVVEDYVERVWSGALPDTGWLGDDALPETRRRCLNMPGTRISCFAASSLEAAAAGEKFFELDLGDGPFTANLGKGWKKRAYMYKTNCSGVVLKIPVCPPVVLRIYT